MRVFANLGKLGSVVHNTTQHLHLLILARSVISTSGFDYEFVAKVCEDKCRRNAAIGFESDV